MIDIIKEIYLAVTDLLEEFFWGFSGSIYSYEAHEFHKKIMSNPDDFDKYKCAISDLRKGAKKVTFYLHNGEKITLY